MLTQQADQICYSVLCVFSYVAAGSDGKRAIASPNMHHKHQPPVQQHHSSKVQQTQHLPQQSTPKLQTIISKPNQSQPQQQQQIIQKPVQVPLKQAGQSVPVKTETVQPPTQQPPKLPAIPARRSSSTTTPPTTEPPKIKPPQLAETSKRAQSVSTTRAPPPIPARTGSISYPNVPPSVTPSMTQQQVRPVRRQNTLSSAMPPVIPQAAPEFYIPQRRGSITRQQSSAATLASQTPKPTK